MASGAGLSCAENHTRNLRSNQNTSGTGRAQGIAMSISSSGTDSGNDAISCGGVPKIVARSAAESARPVAGPVSKGSKCRAGLDACVAPASSRVSVSAAGPFTRVTAHLDVGAHRPRAFCSAPQASPQSLHLSRVPETPRRNWSLRSSNAFKRTICTG